MAQLRLSEVKLLAVTKTRIFICSNLIDVPQELDLLSTMLDRADQLSFDNKDEYVQALKSIAATQTTMYTSDIESLGNLFEGMCTVGNVRTDISSALYRH